MHGPGLPYALLMSMSAFEVDPPSAVLWHGASDGASLFSGIWLFIAELLEGWVLRGTVSDRSASSGGAAPAWPASC